MGLWRNLRIHQTLCIFVLILLISYDATSVSATASKKLKDQEMVPQIPNAGIKCATCPCVNPCAQIPPPPPPPKTPYCPPTTPIAPPPPRFIYVTGDPGGIYHTDADDWGFYSRAERNVAETLLLFAGCGLLGLLIIW